ncbi:hypothetical protein J3169_004408 [Salmonella enterica]|nr:hypothetical protein [Salmonella enterica]
MFTRDAQGLLNAADGLINSASTVSAAVALYQMYLNQPQHGRTPEGEAHARARIAHVASGEWNAERRRTLRRKRLDAERERLFAEVGELLASPFAVELQEERRRRRQERKEFRRILAANVKQWIIERRTVNYMREAAGNVSTFTINRAYRAIKKELGDVTMSNSDMRYHLISEANREKA